MKQRKSSAMWAVALVLIFGFAFFTNATNFFSQPLFPKQEAQHNDAPALSAAETKEQMTKTITNRRGEHQERADGLPMRPAILQQEFKRTEPIENETSTAGQWWREEGRLEEKSEEVRKKRGF